MVGGRICRVGRRFSDGLVRERKDGYPLDGETPVEIQGGRLESSIPNSRSDIARNEAGVGEVARQRHVGMQACEDRECG